MRTILYPLLVSAVVLAAAGCQPQLEYCDIRQRDCQADIFYSVLEQRGDSWDAWSEPPPSEVVPIDVLRDEFLANRPPVPQQTPWDRALILLELLEPSSTTGEADIDSLLENAGAWYSPSTKSVTIIDRGDAGNLRSKTWILAHEYVHAIQDRYDGLDKLYEGIQTIDQSFAKNALIEGEAMFYGQLVLMSVEDSDPMSAPWQVWYDEDRHGTISNLHDDSSRLLSGVWLFVYPVGGIYISSRYLQGGNPAVRALWDDQPEYSLDVLAAPGERAPAPERFACATPVPPAQYTAYGTDSFGPIGLYAAAAGNWIGDATDSNDQVWSLVHGWRHDRMWVLTRHTGGSGTLVLWRLRFSSEAEAAELEAALLAYPNTHAWRVDRAGVEVTLAAADDTTLLDTWNGWRCQ